MPSCSCGLLRDREGKSYTNFENYLLFWMKWFESWFDTAYYHALYAHRNDAEAMAFMDALVNHLQLDQGSKVVDVACGKGRHAAHLAEIGMQVLGLDLSENSIEQAKRLDKDGARFLCHDMREDFPQNGFDAVFNLFTSFGYFESGQEDQRVLQNMYNACTLGGYVVQDYLNANSVIDDLPMEDTLERGGYKFQTRKYRTDKHIVKDITVEDSGEVLMFQEKVRIFTKDELLGLHQQAGLDVLEVFGDYSLGAFDDNSSPRIVLISKKS
jgi:SAM-dependent methyltransferase